MRRSLKVLVLLFSISFPVHAQCAEFLINTFTNYDQRHPSIAYDGDNYLVAWQSDGQEGGTYGGYGIYGQLINKTTGKTGNEFHINTSTLHGQEAPSVTSNGNHFLVTWQTYNYDDGDRYGVYGQLISKNGTKIGSEFIVSDSVTSNGLGYYPSSCSDGNNYLVVWHDTKIAGKYQLFGQLLDSTGNKIGNEFQITNDSGGLGASASFPSVVSNGSNYLLTYNVLQEATYSIVGQLISQEGNLIGSDFQINTSTANPGELIIYPDIASDGNNYFVVWQEGGIDREIYGQLVSSDGALLNEEMLINSYTLEDQSNPAVASNGENYLVLWDSNTQEDGHSYGIYGQYVSLDGTLLGEEMHLNTYTPNNQFEVDVATDGNDYFAGWTSDGQDGDILGVYGRPVPPVPEPSAMFTFALLGVPFLFKKRRA
jgi:hypothetical protein